MKRILVFISVIAAHSLSFATGWQSISNFGSNPGNLNAYEYVPANMPQNAPLVVVMHGCTQNAANFAAETGWNTLAEFHKFYVVHAEQKSANNSTSCFNYWENGDHSRGQGEAASIKQMVDHMKATYSIEASRVYATGLSAGGAMTAVMLSAYPDVFAAGAEMAGLPYKVATSSLEVYTAALGLTSKSPQEWGNLVRAQYPGFKGSYPKLLIIHGTSDIVINENNAEEMMKQFTNVHGIDQNPDQVNANFNGNPAVERKQYKNGNGDVLVERYTIDGMGHGIAVDPGSCFEQGGGTGSNALDVNFYSSFYAAKFFGILQLPFVINGLEVVTDSGSVNYSVTGSAGASYDWQVTGGNIATGQNTNSIRVNWTDTTGIVSLTQTTQGGCVLGPVALGVLIDIEIPVDTTEEPIDTTEEPIDTTEEPIDTTTGIHDIISGDELIILESRGLIEYVVRSASLNQVQVALFNITGQILSQATVPVNQTNRLRDLPPGVYLLQCRTDHGELVRKVVSSR